MRTRICTFLVAVGCPVLLTAQTPAAPATHPVYLELRSLTPGGEALQVTELMLEKDAATFTLTGVIHLLPPVKDRVTVPCSSAAGR